MNVEGTEEINYQFLINTLEREVIPEAVTPYCFFVGPELTDTILC